MAQIIGIASQKGGVGKSTLARMLAVAYGAAGWDVLLADLDVKQGTSVEWARRRNGAPSLSPVHAMPFRDVAGALRAAEKHDLAVLDMPPHSHQGTAELARHADCLLVPTGTTLDDLVPTVRLMHELAKAGLPKERLAAVMVRAVDSEAQIESAHAFVTDAGHECLLPAMPLRNCYASAMDRSRTPAEVAFPKARELAEGTMQAAIDFVSRSLKVKA